MSLDLHWNNPRAYAIARIGDTNILYEELMWFATTNDRLLGLVLRDKVDADYSWCVRQVQACGAAGLFHIFQGDPGANLLVET